LDKQTPKAKDKCLGQDRVHHTKTDKTLEQQGYGHLKDTGLCLVSGRTALPSRQEEWSTCVYTGMHMHTEKKKTTTNIRKLDFIRHSQKPWDCQERAVERKETRKKKKRQPIRSTLILRETVTFSI